ncbi:MAG: hypothetical protein COV36_04580 [Alphaproteobacteria bacterium CG11_big_fil_rev_8_21_14_0_20_44_7]|nr:MAG: hypothetical protein COV36_04580 [Alphaproteobacteria bacterium CG11_big_fil_rev_8_21_14_0_20_44_7]
MTNERYKKAKPQELKARVQQLAADILSVPPQRNDEDPVMGYVESIYVSYPTSGDLDSPTLEPGEEHIETEQDELVKQMHKFFDLLKSMENGTNPGRKLLKYVNFFLQELGTLKQSADRTLEEIEDCDDIEIAHWHDQIDDIVAIERIIGLIGEFHVERGIAQGPQTTR